MHMAVFTIKSTNDCPLSAHLTGNWNVLMTRLSIGVLKKNPPSTSIDDAMSFADSAGVVAPPL